MTQSKHTPGVREVAVFQSAGRESYTVWARLPDGSKEAIFSTQNRGDACLDAAAPEMLEALRGLMWPNVASADDLMILILAAGVTAEQQEKIRPFVEALRKAQATGRAAIRQATGGEG